MESCVYCRKLANLQCQRCREYYCSSECQSADWQSHKFICVAMPALIKSNKQLVIKQESTRKHTPVLESTTEIIEKRPVRQYPDSTLTPMRLPHVNHMNLNVPLQTTANSVDLNCQLKENINYANTNSENTIVNKKITKYDESKNENEDLVSGDAENTSVKGVIGVFAESSPHSSFEQSVKNQLNRRSKKIWKTLKSYSNDFFNAIVQYVDFKNELVWVSDEAWNKESFKLLSETNHNIDHVEAASEKDVGFGSLIIAPLEDVYYRAVVIEEMNPFNEIRVRLLDYGNDFFVQYKKCKKAKSALNDVPSMVFPIIYPKKVEIGDVINIRVLKKNDNNVFSIEEMSTETNNEKSELIGKYDITHNSVLQTLKENFEIKIFHRLDTNKKKAFGLILEDKENFKFLLELSNILNDSSKRKGYDISEQSIPTGSYVGAQFEKNTWRRGLILGSYKNNYLVLFIDDGKIKIVSDIAILPDDFKLIPSLTVCIEFKEIKNKKDYINSTQELSTLICKLPQGSSNGKMLQCCVFDKNVEIGTALLTHFDRNYKNFLLSDSYTYPFVSGDTVCINKVINYSTLSLSLEILIGFYNNIFNEIGEQAEPSSPKHAFIVGDIILFKTKELTGYGRGSIVSSTDNLIYEIIHLESGNLFHVRIDCIKEANDFVKFCPIIIRKASLFILNMMKTQYKFNKAVETLERLCMNKQIFTLQWEKDLAELYFDTEKKLSLNKQLISELYEEVKNVEELNEPSHKFCEKLDVEKGNQKSDNQKTCNQRSDISSSTYDEIQSVVEIRPENQANNIKNFDKVNPKIIKNLDVPKVTQKETSTNINPILDNCDKNKTIKLNDIEVIPLTTGKDVRLLILDTSDIKNGTFTASVDDLEYYKELINVHQPKIKKYCHENTEKEHHPIIGEVCLTFFETDNQWYRAICMKVESNTEFILMLLDYGNIQLSKSTQIRKITKEFLFPCYANTCIFLDFPPKLSTSAFEKLNEIIYPESIISVNNVEKVQEQEYLITFSEIEYL